MRSRSGKYRYFAALLAFCWCVSALGQDLQFQLRNTQFPAFAEYLPIRDGTLSSNVDNTPVSGSRYWHEAFEPGTVYTERGYFGGLLMRYDIYADRIEFEQRGTTCTMDPSPAIRKVKIGDQQLVVEQLNEGKGSKAAFLLLIDSGQVSVMIRKQILYSPARPAAPYTSESPAKFIPVSDKYYIRVKNNPLREVNSVRQVMACLPDKHDDVSRFVREEGLAGRKLEDIVRLVRYYNSL